tara:strand:+ start:92 stop:424 length:333 start_codon:yes stop_codon:yes gene_type:complete
MKRLTVEGIKSLPDVPTQELKIDAWGVSILIQGITKAMQIELGTLLDKDEMSAFDYQKQLLLQCVVEPKLSLEDIDELYNKDANTVDLIFASINELNGIGGSASADEFPE